MPIHTKQYLKDTRDLAISLGYVPRGGKRSLDFQAFCKHVSIIRKTMLIGQSSMVSFGPENWYPEQIDFDVNRTGRDIILKSRQIGMTTLEAIRDLFFALSHPNTKVRIVAHTYETSKQILTLIRETYESLAERFPDLFTSLSSKAAKHKNTQTRLEIRLPMSMGISSIEALTAGQNEGQAQRGRGGKCDRLHCSEVAFFPLPESTMAALFPGCHENAEMVFESTPQHLGDWFYKECQKARLGVSSYKFHFWPWYFHTANTRKPKTIGVLSDDEILLMNKGISAGQLEFWREKKSELTLEVAKCEFAIDSESCFLSGGGMFLSPEERSYLSTITVPENEMAQYQGGLYGSRVYSEPEENKTYCLGADIAGGHGGDNSAIVILCVETGQPVCTFSDNQTSPTQMAQIISELSREYNNASIMVERNHDGYHTLMRLKESPSLNLFESSTWQTSDGAGAWHTNSQTRPALFGQVKDMVRDKIFCAPFCPVLSGELSMIAGGTKPQALNKHKKKSRKEGSQIEPGDTDDLVIAFGIASLIRHEHLLNGGMGNAYEFDVAKNEGIATSIHNPFGLGSIGGSIF